MDKKNFNYRMIKGRVAETIIQHLFLELGFQVFNYGMEYVSPNMIGKVNNEVSSVALQIRSMPDFVIQNPENGGLFYLEVKYRKSGSFSIEELSKDFLFQNALFIIVSRKKIQCLSYDEMKNGKVIKPSSKHYLHERHEFSSIDKSIVIQYLKYAVRFFKDID